MASYIQSGNLVAGSGSVVFTDRHSYVQIENNNGAGLWVTSDGSEAVVGGDDVDLVPAGTTALVANGLPVWYPGYEELDGDATANPGTVINLASLSPTAAYSVQGV